jgi:O-antigen/teichoic acid export membrane protein
MERPVLTDMSLRAFHLLFIALSVVLTAFFAAWAVGQYQTAHDPIYVAACIGSLALGIVLAFYGVMFQRKMRRLS